ncbi:MAG TPA: glycosyltransferase family 39 protein [Streptosporangiaceae bacterium]|nr:glycosyltransferase family 39 protein [Streptosporangiaceae bacterium]
MSSALTGENAPGPGGEGGKSRPQAGTGAHPAAGRAAASAAARYGPIVVPAAAMAVAGVVGLARASSMGNDEVATRWAALLSLRELAHLVRHVDAVHGLYYLLMHAWVAVGSSPAVLRIPSVIAMAVGAAVVAILARRLTGSGWAALFAGLIMVLTPTITYYAQTARSYALVYAGVGLATLALLHAMEAETPQSTGRAGPRWLVYAGLITLSAYLNEMALLVLAAHAVTVLLARYGRRACWHWAAAACGAGILVLPLLALSITERAAISFLGRPGLGAIKTLFHDYFGATTLVALLLLACAVIAVLPVGPAWQTRLAASPAGPGANPEPSAWWRGGISLPSVAGPLLVVPALLLLIESRVLPPLYIDRYVLYGEAGAALLAGAGAYRIGQWLAQDDRWRALIWVPGTAICVLALVLQLGPQTRIRTPQSRAYDFGGPSRYVAAHARQGDGVLYFGTLFRKAELGYPADFRKVDDFAEAISPMQAGNFRGTDKSLASTIPLMLDHQRIWVIGARPSQQLSPAALSQESATLARSFRLIASRHFRGISVTLWQRR